VVEPWCDLRPGVGGLLGQMQAMEALRGELVGLLRPAWGGKLLGCRGRCGEGSRARCGEAVA
jgi:hypothetical protein